MMTCCSICPVVGCYWTGRRTRKEPLNVLNADPNIVGWTVNYNCNFWWQSTGWWLCTQCGMTVVVGHRFAITQRIGQTSNLLGCPPEAKGPCYLDCCCCLCTTTRDGNCLEQCSIMISIHDMDSVCIQSGWLNHFRNDSVTPLYPLQPQMATTMDNICVDPQCNLTEMNTGMYISEWLTEWPAISLSRYI